MTADAKQITDPIEMLKELEAYLTFRLMAENPHIPSDDMRQIWTDIKFCLRENGIETSYQSND